MISLIAWLVRHFDVIAAVSIAAGVGGLVTPRFAARQNYSVEVESWLGNRNSAVRSRGISPSFFHPESAQFIPLFHR